LYSNILVFNELYNTSLMQFRYNI